MVTVKDGNRLNEVELLADSLMSNDALLRGHNVIKPVPDESVTKINVGERISLNESRFPARVESVLRRDRGQVRGQSETRGVAGRTHGRSST